MKKIYTLYQVAGGGEGGVAAILEDPPYIHKTLLKQTKQADILQSNKHQGDLQNIWIITQAVLTQTVNRQGTNGDCK